MGYMNNLYVLYTHTHTHTHARMQQDSFYVMFRVRRYFKIRGLQKMFLSLYDNIGHIYLHHWPGTKTLKEKS